MAEQFEQQSAAGNPRELFRAQAILAMPQPIIEVGTMTSVPGRSTHRLDWFPYLARRDYIMADVAKGEDVDEVCNIHALPPTWENRFGAFVAVSVFEHLERPWIAARQMFNALKPGGLCYVATHQSFPLHGFPNDFFRFSAAALELIFKDAGFVVNAAGYEERCSIIPPETTLPGGLIQQWNANHPSYIHVHLFASKPPVAAVRTSRFAEGRDADVHQ